MTSVTQAVATRSNQVEAAAQQQGRTTAAFLRELSPQLARALPRGLNADRLARIALTEVRKTPDLTKCSQESFAAALLTSAQLGLEPGATGEAYLVPYGREVSLIIGYQGYAKLFWQSPLAKHLDSAVVYERDDFDYAKGTEPFLRHKPASGDRGQATHVWAAASLTSGGSSFVVLTLDEVKALRGGKAGPDPRFKGGDPQRWMDRKTALRQLFKLLPKSAELAQALVVDEQPQALPDVEFDPATGEVIEGEVAA